MSRPPGPTRPRPAGGLRPALLSGLVFPGLGQLANRHYGRALALGGASLALVAVLLRRVVAEASARIPADPDQAAATLLDDPAWPLHLASEIQRANAAFFLWITVAIVAVWALAVWDAWRGAGRPAPPP
jgi:hypothetical protein